VRFTVTALGSIGGRSVASVVADITEYLTGAITDLAAPDGTPPVEGGNAPGPDGTRPGPDADGKGRADAGSVPERGPDRYYADSGEGPGRWLGRGSGELGLAGTVQAEAFRSVLAGRDPRNGARLISARGSTGRVRDLGAGTVTRFSDTGEALYSPGDVAAVLGWSRADVDAAVAEGEHSAAGRLVAMLTQAAGTDGTAPGSTGGTVPGRDPGAVLVPVVDPAGSRWIPESEVSRVEALVTESRPRDTVLAGGAPTDELSVPEASRLVGASRSYLARLCRTYAEHQAEIDAAVADGTPPGRAYLVSRRDGSGAWRITRQALADYIDRRRQPAVRVGYDITATTEKSISVLALLSGPETRRAVLASVQSANDTAMDWLEHQAAAARAGNQVVGVTGWTAAAFRHLTSRRLDPFVHHHNVVANTVVDENGERRALDARRLYRRVAAAGGLATAQVRYELTRRLGVTFRPGRHGGWEIDGIDDAVIDEFSQRTREINDAIRELEDALGRTTTLAELQTVIANSRPAKQAVDNEAAVIGQWWQRARAHGLTPEHLQQVCGQARPTQLSRAARSRVLTSLAGEVTSGRSVFTRGDVLAALVDLADPTGGPGPLIVTAAELERLADDFLASSTVVPLASSTGRNDVLHRADGNTVAVGGAVELEYSTTEILALQARVLDRYGTRNGDTNGRVQPQVVAEVLARFPELGSEQRRLVETFCTSGHGAQSAIGRPGTGKTHAMRAAVAAWQTAGYRVLGTAVKAEAARHLGDECNIPAEPLAWYTARFDDPAHSPLDARTVLIVDEASTIGDRDLDRLLVAAEAAGATVRFIGDPAQHGSVLAGGLWRVITERFAHQTPQLTVGRRVRHHTDQQAAEALRAGRAGKALELLEAAGHLHIVPSERELYAALLTRWWDGRQTGRPHPMVDRRNDQRLVLNRLARQLRRQMGELGTEELVAAGDRRFAVGDEVTARMGTRDLHPSGRPDAYVRNGAHGTVAAVHRHPEGRHQDELTVDFAGLGTIVVPRPFFDEHTDPWGRIDVGIDHAYAVTSYAVEGLTYDESSSHVDPRSTRPEVYVDITRGRDANHVYVTAAADLLDGERLPAVPSDPERDQLADRLTRSGTEVPAIDLDPLAWQAAHHAHGKTLAHLHRERVCATDDTARGLAAHAERVRERQIARRAVSRPDPRLVAQLIDRPDHVFLATAYDDLLAEMAIYRARWEPTPGRGGSWTWALGRPPTDAGAVEERHALADKLERFALRTIARHLPDDYRLSDTARTVIGRLAATGAIGARDLDELAQAITVYDQSGRNAGEVYRDIVRESAAPRPNGPNTARDSTGVA